MALLARLTGTHETVGIDVGSHMIKVVQVAVTRNGYELKRAGGAPTPAGAIKQGVVDDRLAVADAVHNLLRTLGITTPLAVAGVAGPSVTIRQVQLPAMPEQQLRKSIYWEARNFISTPVEDSLLDFQILGTHTTDGSPQMDVMLVATPRELVDTRVAALEEAGLEPIAIELEPFALMRSVVALPLGLSGMNETVALVEIGATYTHISIISNGTFVLSRSVTTAGDSFTAAIASALNQDATAAEKIKETDLVVVTDEVARAALSPVGQEASRALEPVLEELTREIRRSFAFYDYQQVPGGAPRNTNSVTRVILTGGSAKVGGLVAYLQEQLSIPVELVDLFNHPLLQLPPESAEELRMQAPLLSTALGLALREPMLAREKRGLR